MDDNMLVGLDGFSDHAHEMAVRRNLSMDDIFFVLDYGKRFFRTGIEFHFLRRKDVPQDHRDDERVRQLIGTTVLLAHDGTLITVYRNAGGLRQIKRKEKYHRLGSMQRRQAAFPGAWALAGS